MRSFIALELPHPVVVALEDIQHRLRASVDCPASWVSPGGMHLTLAFLGDIETERVEVIRPVLTDVCERMGSFKLKLAGAGAFPGSHRPEVIWIGLSGETERLNHLHSNLWRNLAGVGFVPEKRPFHAHLTLARIRETASADQRHELIETLDGVAPKATDLFQIDILTLWQSQLRPAGAAYSRLSSCRLKAA